MAHRFRTVFGGLALFAACCPGGQSIADDHYSKPDLRVIPAQDVLQFPRDGQQFRYDTPLYLVKNDLLSDQDRRDLIQRHFEVRVFRIEGPHSEPQPWYSDRDGCDVFLTMVFKGLRFTGDRSDIASLANPRWITKTTDGAPLPGYFLMVVEQESALDVISERPLHWEVFRLGANRRDAYFHAGIKFSVEPEYGDGPPDLTPAEEGQIRAALNDVAARISKQFNCYKANITQNTASAQELRLAACSDGNTAAK